MYFLTSLISISLLVALALPGYILVKTRLLPQDSSKAFTVFLLYVCQPFLTVQSFIKSEYTPELLKNLGFVVLFAFLFLIGFTLLCALVFKGVRDETARRASIGVAVFSNCAFMGIPFLQALFPSDPTPVLYCNVFVIVFNLLAWTLLVFVITGEKKHISVKRAILNPPTVALVVALPLFFTNAAVPNEIMIPLDFLANMTSPVSMTVLGIRLASVKLKELFIDLRLYFASAVRLVAVPLLSLGVLLLFRLFCPLDVTTVTTLYILMAMPSATIVVLLSERFGSDSSFAAKATLLTSVLSFVTVPVLMLLCNFI